MKTKSIFTHLVFVGLTIHALSGISLAQVTPAAELEIGPTGSNQATGVDKYNGALGSGNTVSSGGSFAIGYSNRIYVCWSSLAVGSYNDISSSDSLIVGSQNISSSGPNFVFGTLNAANGSNDLVSGVGNIMEGSSEYGGPSIGTAFGAYNYISSSTYACFVAGTNNFIWGGAWDYVNDSPIFTENAALFGRGLYTGTSNSMTVGQYNQIYSGALFAVGNGDDSTHRSNAFEVYVDGTIMMSRQGDILMGEFGVPEP